MSYLFKDFLNLEDVGEYLNQYGYSYDPEIEEDCYRLKGTILDLYNEQKLSIVFYYDDFATIKTLQVTENGSTEQLEEFEFYISGYFHAPEATSIIKDGANLRIIPSYYSYYLLHDKNKLPIYDDDDKYRYVIGSKFTSIEFGDDIAPSIVELDDIRFPKDDLDKLFNNENNELVDVKEQNAKLIADKEENETTGSFSMGTPAIAHGELETNEQLREALAAANKKIKQQAQDINNLNQHLNQQAGKLADGSYQLNDRNEKSYKTTIGLLLELMTVPKVESDRPPFTSEAVIIGRITDKSIYGQGKTTLETRFRDAKMTLQQTKKKAFKP